MGRHLGLACGCGTVRLVLRITLYKIIEHILTARQQLMFLLDSECSHFRPQAFFFFFHGRALEGVGLRLRHASVTDTKKSLNMYSLHAGNYCFSSAMLLLLLACGCRSVRQVLRITLSKVIEHMLTARRQLLFLCRYAPGVGLWMQNC